MKILAILLFFTFIAAISVIDDSDESLLFETPCTKDEEKLLENMLIQQLAEKLSDQAYTTLGTMEQFKDEFAEILQNQGNFDILLKSLKGKEWLRAFDWYMDEVLPKEKDIGTSMPPTYLEKFHNQSQEFLPKMHKALKMLLGGLVELKTHGFDSFHDETVQYIRKYIDDSIDSVKSVLCTFTKFMQSSDVGLTLSLTQNEVPKLNEESNGLLYRDTLNFLEYISQVFKFIAHDIEELLCEVKTSIGIPCDPSP